MATETQNTVKLSVNEKSVIRYYGRLAALGIVGLIGLSALSSSFFTISQRDAGVVTHWKEFSYIAKPGLHFKNPFTDSVVEYTTATQQVEIEKAGVNTSDNQKSYITMLVQYDTPPDGIKIIYEKYPDYGNRIYSLASDIMKNEFGNFQVMDIPVKRYEIEQNILAKLAKEAKRLYGANITEVQIKDIGYTNAFEASIDRMTKAKADVEQAAQHRLQASVEAEQEVVVADGHAKAVESEARGHAEAIELEAKANADKTRLEGEAQAASIKAQTDALNASPQFVRYTIAKGWNGQLPTNIGVGASANSIPMLNIGSLNSDK